MNTFACTSCTWTGTETAMTENKVVDESGYPVEVSYQHIRTCPKCFQNVRRV